MSKILFNSLRTRRMLDKFKGRSETALIYKNAEINLPIDMKLYLLGQQNVMLGLSFL